MALVLIDNLNLKILKAVDSVEQAEYWAEILIPNNDFLVVGTSNKEYAVYTHYELRKIFHNCTGRMLGEDFPYPKLISGITEYAGNMDLDETPVETLRDMLGRDLPEPTTAPVKSAPAESSSQAAKDPSRPKPGTSTGQVWEIADKLSEEAEGMAERKDVIARCEDMGINKATASTQYGKWKKWFLAQ